MEQRCFNALDALFLSLNVLVFYGQSVIATTCNGTIMSDAVRMGVLEEINAIRTMLEKGILTDIDFNEYPKAEAMYKLQWSCEFEEIANGFVQGCQQSPPTNPPDGHSFGFRAFPYNNGILYEHITTITLGGWRLEADGISATNMYNPQIANLSNVLNATLTAVCSTQLCGGGIIGTVACIFDNPPLKTGDAMYKVGEPCTVDGNCTAYTPATCNTTARLCQLDDTTTSAPTTTSTLSTESTTVSVQSTTRGNLHPNPEINQICSDNVYMNDRIRVKALNMHNYRRSQLAKGEVAKFNGNKLPSAANMVTLNYDCTLETAAYAHANTCSNTYSSPSSRLGIEENIHLVSGQTVAYRVDAMGEAIKFWWKQIRLETVSIGMAVTFKRPHLNSQIRFFTMMAWATTTKLGCGVARCSGNFFVVCHYQPGGNVVDDTVYTKGSPCSRCPTGSYCSTPLCVTV